MALLTAILAINIARTNYPRWGLTCRSSELPPLAKLPDDQTWFRTSNFVVFFDFRINTQRREISFPSRGNVKDAKKGFRVS